MKAACGKPGSSTKYVKTALEPPRIVAPGCYHGTAVRESMTLTIAFALLQLVVSARPGLVDIADGEVSARQYEQIAVGKTIRTGPRSHLQFSLGWEAFLRLEENSSAVLESADRATVAVRIESGSGLVEVADINRGSRIVITSGNLKALIDSRGVYRFSENSVSVIKGKLKTFDKSMEAGEGWQLTNLASGYQRTRFESTIAQEFKRFMSGPKAGFVNAVHGQANVRLHEVVQPRRSIETGPASYVELLLAPGSFLRLDGNSAVIIESNSLNDATVRVSSGAVLLESAVVDAQLRTNVIVGPRKTRIGSVGLYRFTSDTARVLAGSLQIDIDSNGLGYRIGKGRQIVTEVDAYKESDIPAGQDPDGLDRWSALRSYEVAAANFLSDYGDVRPNFFLFRSQWPNDAAWIYSPRLNGFTFLPRRRYVSHYKQTFVPLYVFMPPPVLLPNVPILSQPPFGSGRPADGGYPGDRPAPAPNPEPAPTPAPAPAPEPAPSPEN
jgi:hypothetical protein